MADPLDVIEMLTADHRLMNSLLDRLDAEDHPAEMHRLFLRIADALAAHEAAEHDVVFPAALAALPDDDREVLDLIAGHDEVNSLLAEMLHLDPSGFGFLKRASALIFDLQAHFAAEENVLFPRLRAVLDPAERAWLAARVRVAKHAAPVFPAGCQTGPRPPFTASA